MSRAVRRVEHVGARSRALLLALAMLCAHVGAPAVRAAEPEPRVVLVTFDGVRWNEIFEGADPSLVAEGTAFEGEGATALLPYFWSEMVEAGTLLGDRRIDSEFTITNPIGISIPGYQVIFTGRITFCLRNECGPPSSETFPERLLRELSLPREQVAAFVTDPNLCSALERNEGTIHTRCGPPRGEKKSDLATFEAALAHLEAHRPRFLFIGLDLTDATAHTGKYAAHLDMLHRYDTWLGRLDDALEGLGEAGEQTTVIVTTDHGRGEGEEWRDHKLLVPASREVWLYARGPGVPRQGSTKGRQAYSHRDIRPSIERIFGLEPISGLLYGEPIDDLFED